MKALYGFLVSLHPPAFRRKFGPEMTLDFEESGSPLRLFADLFLSLVRQWIWRSGLWVVAPAATGGLVPFALSFGFLRLSRRLFLPAAITPPVFLLAAALMSLLPIVMTLILSIAWFRFSRRRLRA